MVSGARTPREQVKAERTAALLDAATRLFAEFGFASVSLEQLGSAVGITGPAIYRHFANKQAVLAAVLYEASLGLLNGGKQVVAEVSDSSQQLHALVAFHVNFSINSAGVIRVQDRDLTSLAAQARHDVRRVQREYVELWVAVLRAVHPDEPAERLRVRAHAGFGLMNSTPHSARASGAIPALGDVRSVLEAMTLSALRAV